MKRLLKNPLNGGSAGASPSHSVWGEGEPPGEPNPRDLFQRSLKGRQDKAVSDLMKEIGPIAANLARIQKQAKALGIFINDREPLECSGCDLVEDVAFDGSLMTYHAGSADMSDCGLRFEETEDGVFRCPACGAILKAVIL